MAESLYDILGVAKTASADQIRKAYRKLARTHHPDVNPGNSAAEEKFKKVSAAYDVLSDEKKRAAYDEFGDASLQGGFDPDKARDYQRWQQTQQQRASRFHDMEDDDGPASFDFSELFGRARGPQRGADLHASLQLDLKQALEGTEISLDLPTGPTRVRIPPGADDGSTIRIAGKGAPGGRGGPPGDLLIEIAVAPHPRVRREGMDLHLTVPVTLAEAYVGATIDVPTFGGPVSVKVPPRSQNGAKLRLRGKGVTRKDKSGDMIIELEVRMPDREDQALASALEAAAADYSRPVREGMTL
ncbi:MAG: DnaJ domain-containing protein [Deltaproteobacteria bacterium]|nr:DnaJ domain-containing protein [Deltaproteobacteria bacterium]